MLPVPQQSAGQSKTTTKSTLKPKQADDTNHMPSKGAEPKEPKRLNDEKELLKQEGMVSNFPGELIFREMIKKSRSVFRITAQYGNRVDSGTGFLVQIKLQDSPKLFGLLTADHVVNVRTSKYECIHEFEYMNFNFLSNSIVQDFY